MDMWHLGCYVYNKFQSTDSRTEVLPLQKFFHPSIPKMTKEIVRLQLPISLLSHTPV